MSDKVRMHCNACGACVHPAWSFAHFTDSGMCRTRRRFEILSWSVFVLAAVVLAVVAS